MLALAVALLALTDGVAQARVVFAHGHAYGVTPTPKVRKAQALFASRGRATALSTGGPQPPVVYHNGPLMLTSKLYLIFWQQKAGEFPSEYTGPIIQYAKDLQVEDSRTTDEFSVAEQYTNNEGRAITGKVEFGDDVFATGPYPPLEESEGCTKAKAPCVTDTQIRKEIAEQIEANHWPTDPASAPEAQYLLYTPKGVTTCEFGECAPEEFCAYHSEITELGPEKKVAVYSDLPYVPECDSGQAPTGVGGNKDADGTLDSEIHEIVESATDPEPETGYTDEHHEEVADKCTGPTVELQPEVYGTPLGGSLRRRHCLQPADQRSQLLHAADLEPGTNEDASAGQQKRSGRMCRADRSHALLHRRPPPAKPATPSASTGARPTTLARRSPPTNGTSVTARRSTLPAFPLPLTPTSSRANTRCR